MLPAGKSGWRATAMLLVMFVPAETDCSPLHFSNLTDHLDRNEGSWGADPIVSFGESTQY